MRNWDYSWRGYYFVTICTIGRECFFGDIVNGRMRLSDIGKIANTEWLKSPIIRPDMNLTLDEYIIMPNHIHGIIKMDHISTTPEINANNKFGPQRNNLSSVIRGFKSAVTINARKLILISGGNHDFMIV